jgi:ferritin-like metal-binding protein YciE
MQMESLQDLFIDNLKDLYNAEKQLLRALPKMAKAAENDELREAFENHTEETKVQVERLEQIFEGLGKKPTGKTCKAMQGLIEENKELLEEDAEPEVLDAGMIVGAQKVEHYEIAGYGSMVEFAKLLGNKEAASLLAQTLNEEEKTDKLLTALARKSINVEAQSDA